jgi:hypothetical protein
VPDADESLRQYVCQEAPDELFGGNRHQALLIAVSVIPPSKRDVITIEGHQPMIRNRDAVRVASEIPEDLLRSAECGLRINNPVVAEQRP